MNWDKLEELDKLESKINKFNKDIKAKYNQTGILDHTNMEIRDSLKELLKEKKEDYLRTGGDLAKDRKLYETFTALENKLNRLALINLVVAGALLIHIIH